MADDIRKVRSLTPGEAGDDRRKGVHVGLEDDTVGDAPALPARFWPLRNQRFFCSRLRSALLVERLVGRHRNRRTL